MVSESDIAILDGIKMPQRQIDKARMKTDRLLEMSSGISSRKSGEQMTVKPIELGIEKRTMRTEINYIAWHSPA